MVRNKTWHSLSGLQSSPPNAMLSNRPRGPGFWPCWQCPSLPGNRVTINSDWTSRGLVTCSLLSVARVKPSARATLVGWRCQVLWRQWGHWTSPNLPRKGRNPLQISSTPSVLQWSACGTKNRQYFGLAFTNSSRGPQVVVCLSASGYLSLHDQNTHFGHPFSALQIWKWFCTSDGQRV